MANRDRLTALDAAFLHLETQRRPHARRPACSSSRARRPPTTSSSRRSSARLHLVPRYRQKLALRRRSARAARCGSTTRTSTPATTCATRALPAPGGRRAAAQPRRARCSPSRWTATKPLWELWLVEGLEGGRFAIISQDPPRARRRRLRRRHHVGALRRLARPAPAGGRGARRGCRARSRPTPSCWPRRCSSARRCRPRAPAALRALTRAPRQVARAGRRAARRRRRDGLGRAQPGAAVALQRADRPAPALRVGRRRPRALQGDQERARRHAQRRRAVRGGAARSGASCAAAASTPTGSCSRRWSRCRCAPTTERGALGNRVAAM